MKSLIIQLLVVLVLTIVAATSWSRLNILRDRAATARDELPLLRDRIHKIKEERRKISTIHDSAQTFASEIRKFDTSYILTPDTPLPTASKEIRSRSSDSGLEILTLIESTARPPDAEPGPDGQLLTPYRISLEMRGTEAAAIRFIRKMEDANPLIQFHHYSILNMTTGTTASIFATIEWPMWNGDDKPALLKTLADTFP